MTDAAAEAYERHDGSLYRFIHRHGSGRTEGEKLPQRAAL